MTFNCQVKDFLEESKKEMQAEGGFGRRRILLVALPARLSLDLNNSPTEYNSACMTILLKHLLHGKPELLIFDDTFFTSGGK